MTNFPALGGRCRSCSSRRPLRGADEDDMEETDEPNTINGSRRIRGENIDFAEAARESRQTPSSVFEVAPKTTRRGLMIHVSSPDLEHTRGKSIDFVKAKQELSFSSWAVCINGSDVRFPSLLCERPSSAQV